ncbi:MAG: PQQ-binding-like beta-propeller repeat protein, partial [Gammaproteobacteria bacterium]|nr:PQQ-binding-like beta-propeller repeat protein [Gammaproteobacteria bacterium]
IDGEPRKVLFNANRNGFLYSLDRASGELITAREFAEQSWALSLEENGRPQRNPSALPSAGGTRVWPNSVGATNWWPPAYHPRARLLCLPVVDGPSVYYTQETRYEPGKPFVAVVGQQSFNEAARRFVRCLNDASGALVWEKELQTIGGRLLNINMSGLLMTAGNLLFAGDNTDFIALHAITGDELWRINTGGSILGPPVSYRAGGSQFVVVTSGRTLLAFGLPAEP